MMMASWQTINQCDDCHQRQTNEHQLHSDRCAIKSKQLDICEFECLLRNVGQAEVMFAEIAGGLRGASEYSHG